MKCVNISGYSLVVEILSLLSRYYMASIDISCVALLDLLWFEIVLCVFIFICLVIILSYTR